MTVGTGLLRSADIRSPDTAMGCSPIVFFPLTQRVTGTSRELLPSEQTDDDWTVATADLSGAAAATTGRSRGWRLRLGRRRIQGRPRGLTFTTTHLL